MTDKARAAKAAKKSKAKIAIPFSELRKRKGAKPFFLHFYFAREKRLDRFKLLAVNLTAVEERAFRKLIPADHCAELRGFHAEVKWANGEVDQGIRSLDDLMEWWDLSEIDFRAARSAIDAACELGKWLALAPHFGKGGA